MGDPVPESDTGVAYSDADLLKAAIAAHQAGQLAAAIGLYERALSRAGENGLVLHLMGVACHQSGAHARAAALLERAARVSPSDPAVHASLADVRIALGDYEQAEARARECVRLGGDAAKGHYLLGLALQGLMRHAEAVEHLQRAISEQPGFVAAYNHLGNAFRSLGRLAEAKDAYLHAIALDPALAVAHCNLGSIHLAERQLDEARRALASAVEFEPGRAFFWERLAELYQWCEDFDAAIPCWERVLALTADPGARPHLALGRALHERNRLDEAEAHYRAAAACKPESAAAHLNLGRLRQEQGQFAEAEAAFRSALRIEPTLPLAHVRLATLLGGALPEPDLAGLRERLDAQGTDPSSRARLLFALGQVLDARGAITPAAAAFRSANALSLAHDGRAFDRAALERFVALSVQAYNPEFFRAMAGAGIDTRRPVFIVGLPRSGSTLLEQILASHSRVHAAGELALGQWAFESLPGLVRQKLSPMLCVPHLEPSLVRSLAGAYADRLSAIDGGRAERIVDKMPENYKHLGLLAALFPSATVIHCQRDLRDVALSCYIADFLKVPWANDPEDIAASFRAYSRLMDHWRAVLPIAIHEFRYEETVRDLEGVARRLLAMLGLDWEPACVNFPQVQRAVRTGSLVQVREPIHERSVGRWRRYEQALGDLFAGLPEVEETRDATARD